MVEGGLERSSRVRLVGLLRYSIIIILYFENIIHFTPHRAQNGFRLYQ